MTKYIISVKKDRLNEHLLEGDHDFLSFLDILDKYTVTLDTLSNFSIVIDYEIQVPVYLSALQVLKSHSNNEEIIGKRIPLYHYVNGYFRGVQSDINPGVDKVEYLLENITSIFQSMIQPFHYDNTYRQIYDSGMVSHLNIIGFSENLWFEYGIQIGKQKQAWDIILKDPDAFITYLDMKCVPQSQKSIISNLYENIVTIKRILQKIEINEEENFKSKLTNQEKEENNFLKSTIEDYLFQFKSQIKENDYDSLVKALMQYFENGSFPILSQKIKIGKVNKKKFGWALNEIYRTDKSGKLSLEYLRFANKYLSIFETVTFDENDYVNSNLYKYFTTKL
ncbi:MAG: hypothetical protein IPK88_18040 [Saprospiraceae bacterium]|nr:hypothetical protein [Candidatus Defluviibacterium haderslevense]